MEFDARLFQSHLETRHVGRFLVYRRITETTMTIARREAMEGAPHGCLVLAEEQTAGRGRRGRSFYSPAGENLYFTLVLRLDSGNPNLPIALPLAVVEACRDAGADARIKWPNDIWAGGLKVCGMLIDAETGSEGTVVMPGIGINVNFDPSVNPELQGIATSLAKATGQRVAREPLLARICNLLELYLEQDAKVLLPRYRELSVVLGRRVHVSGGPEGDFEAMVVELGPGGELIVERDGQRQSVVASDVSLRPVD